MSDNSQTSSRTTYHGSESGDMPLTARQLQALKGSPGHDLQDARWTDILEIVCDNTFFEWPSLATHLGLSDLEQEHLRKNASTPQDRCWKVMELWRSRTPKNAWSYELMEALTRCRHGRMADIVHRLCSSKGSVDEVLGKHTDREERMREAFYVLAESAPQKWRHLASKLGLTGREVSTIENRFEGRPREKCMHALYKWRLLVPLSDYKVAGLVRAARACGLNEAADQLAPLGEKNNVPPTPRKKRSGEAIIHLGVLNIDVERPTGDAIRSSVSLSKDGLKDYILNKVFLTLLDGLEAQDSMGAHDLMTYFHELNRSTITRVSRRGFYIAVNCGSRDEVQYLYKLSRDGELGRRISQCLITDEILEELNVYFVELQAVILETELVTPTPRSQGEVYE